MLDKILQTLTLTRLDAIAIPIAGFAFYFFYRLLAKNVFAPYLTIYEEREAAITGSIASEDKETALALEEQYETELAKKRAELVKKKLEKVGMAQKEAEKLIQEAEKTAASEVANYRSELLKEVAAKKATLPNEARKLAEEIVRRVLV